MIAVELAVVGSLIVLAWNVVASASRSVPIPPAVQAVDASSHPGSSLPQVPELPPPPLRGPLPGLNLDSSFWRERLVQLNAEQIYLEQLEWQIVHSAESAVERYLETVVLPAIQRAEHATGAVVL